MRSNKYCSKGFTLIELLVVISIIGLLSTVVLTNLQQARKQSGLTVDLQAAKSLSTALELYYQDNSTYPGAGTTYIPTSPGWNSVLKPALAPYLSKMPQPQDPNTFFGYVGPSVILFANPGNTGAACINTLAGFLILVSPVPSKFVNGIYINTFQLLGGAAKVGTYNPSGPSCN